MKLQKYDTMFRCIEQYNMYKVAVTTTTMATTITAVGTPQISYANTYTSRPIHYEITVESAPAVKLQYDICYPSAYYPNATDVMHFKFIARNTMR